MLYRQSGTLPVPWSTHLSHRCIHGTCIGHNVHIAAIISVPLRLTLSQVTNTLCADLTSCCITGANTHVRKAIIDKNARIGSNVKIINKGDVRESNQEQLGFVIKDGIVVVIKDSIIPDGTVI